MKRKIKGILVVILLASVAVLPVTGTLIEVTKKSTLQSTQSNSEIINGMNFNGISVNLKGGFGLTIEVINDYNQTISNLNCACDIFMEWFKKHLPDLIVIPKPDPLPPIEKAVGKTGFLFGLGPANITILTNYQIEGENYEHIQEATGFIFGPFVFNVRNT